MIALLEGTAAAGEPVWTPLAPAEARAFAVAEVSRDATIACARSTDGRVACWGESVAWAGITWAPPSSVPLLLAGVDDAVDIAHAGALYVARSDGTVTRVRERELGPVPGFAGVVQLERAGNGVCGRSRDGSVACYGWIDWLERAGENVTPLKLTGVALACGSSGCCTWDAAGVLSCAGESEHLGLRRKPSLPGGAPRTGVGALALGDGLACARVGDVHHCWGDALPEGFAPPPGSTLSFSSYGESCWVLAGRASCQGRDGESWTHEGVASIVDRCAVLTDGGLACWGDNEHGELADGVPLRVTVPSEVPGVRATALAAGYDDTCAVQGERLWCWGGGEGRPTDVGAAPGRFEPAAYVAGCGWWGSTAACVGRTWSGSGWAREELGIDSGTAFAADRAPNFCRVDDAGEVACRLSLGEGGPDGTWRPLKVREPATDLAPTSVGMVVLGKSGAVHQWTDDRFDEDPDFVDVPSAIVANPVGVTGARLVTGHQNGGCAVTGAGLECWGGGLGFMSTPVPVSPAFAGATSLDGNHWHVCGVVAGKVLCVGAGEDGQLATEVEFASAPVEVPLPGPAVEVAVGGEHSCARLEDGRVFCWGSDAQGALGQGRVIRAERPVQSVFAR